MPAIRYADEQAVLRCASRVPVYDTRPIELRVAALDCHVSYRGVRYSVAPLAAGHTVKIRASGERVGDAFTLLLGAVEVGTHGRRASGTPDVTLPAHAAAVRALTRWQSSAARRPGPHRPHFVQAPGERTHIETRHALDAIRRLAPMVETRALDVYEAVA